MDFSSDCNTIFMKIKRVLLVLSITIVSFVLILGIGFFLLTNPAVKIAGWKELDVKRLDGIYNTITVKDRDGIVIAENLLPQNRIFTPLQEVPMWTRDAFISIEDKRFYKHSGVDYIRMLGALKNNIFAASLQEGASTITQQLIKNSHLSNEKTFLRKFQEIRIAKQLEKVYTKEKILETYLNMLYFGNNVYGIGQAARSYFDKEVSQLDIAESALLAGIINNPSRFNPVTHADRAIKRRNTVIGRMVANNKVEASVGDLEKKKEMAIKMQILPYSTCMEGVIAEASKVLDCLPEELFERKPIITLNTSASIFDQLSCSMSDILHESACKIRILVIENQTRNVLFDESNAPSASTIKRQPGSTIKPFIGYAPALEKKLVFPASVLVDERTDFDGYSPKNFDDRYYGKITVADSLKYSQNVPAVKLTDMSGLPYAKAVASRFGFTFGEEDRGLALALGGLHDGVTLQQIADAYVTLANGGIYSPSHYIADICAEGKCIYENSLRETRAVGEDTAFLLSEMLRACAKSGTAKKLSVFDNVAAKTGTVERGEKNSDAYCIAFTPKYTVAVWYGNDEETGRIYGGREPTELAKTLIGELHDVSAFTIPSEVEVLDVDRKKLYEEGVVYLASPMLPKRYRESFYFSKNNLPKRFSYPEVPFIFEDAFDSTDFKNFEIVDSVG